MYITGCPDHDESSYIIRSIKEIYLRNLRKEVTTKPLIFKSSNFTKPVKQIIHKTSNFQISTLIFNTPKL